MTKQTRPTVSDLTGESLQQLIDNEKVLIVAFVESKESSEFEIFKNVAELLRNDYTFGVVSDATVAAAHGSSVPGILLFKKFDEGKNKFEGAYDVTEVTDFVKTNAIPLMADIGPDNYATYAEAGTPLAYFFFGNDEHRAQYGPLIEAVAKDFKGKINFVYIDGSKYGGHAGNMNLKQEWPAFAIQRPQQNLKFPYDQSKEITTEGIREFVQSFLDDSLEPSLKSDEIPVQSGPVVVVVNKQYNEIVNQPKDVLIEFYAPWCGHCKKLAPTFDELGEKLKSNKNIVIAKMDATTNDLPADVPFQVSGFPTIKLVKTDNTVVDYNGDRSLESFIDFLKKNSTYGKDLVVAGENVESTDSHPHDKDEL